MEAASTVFRFDLDHAYAERVYAGVLGKIIGVYLGRPFEGWQYRDILAKLGEVDYYVHEKLNSPLIVTDDDISGTFTFLRALEDYGYDANLTAQQIGQTWLNYLIEKKTVLWWGGMGTSTEHTAYLRLKHGIPAPKSGSIAQNGQVVAEQIGAQIFIDGWGLINPGDPERAAHFARLAGSVSHDGESIYGAQVQAALVAQAFVEGDIDRLIDTAIAQVPSDSLVSRMVSDIREWHGSGQDWRKGFLQIEGRYGYDRYGGGCHIIPNHALIIHALLHGKGDFQESLKVVNTCGWDTDCNSGNVGCVIGVLRGLEGIDQGPDWRGPVADRMYLPTADGGRAVTDAVQETYRIVNTARSLRGSEPTRPKNGARYHFSLPGSVQGFVGTDACVVANGDGRLGIRYFQLKLSGETRVCTETFPGASARKMGGYEMVASPTLYSGQQVRAYVTAADSNRAEVEASLTIGVANSKDEVETLNGDRKVLAPGQSAFLQWTVPDTHGYPVCDVGLALTSSKDSGGMIYLDWLTWDQAPNVLLCRCEGKLWREAWVNGLNDFSQWGEPYRLIQNEGTGLLIQGAREWTDYRVTATVIPHLAEFAGVAARVQGMRRYYGLLLHRSGEIRLVKALDGDHVLASKDFAWEFGSPYELSLTVMGDRILGYVDGEPVLEATDADLTGGGVAYVICEGRMMSDEMRVEPVG